MNIKKIEEEVKCLMATNERLEKMCSDLEIKARNNMATGRRHKSNLLQEQADSMKKFMRDNKLQASALEWSLRS